MNQINTQNQTKKPLNRVPDSFVEALRDIGSSTKHNITSNAQAAGKSILDQFTGHFSPDTNSPDQPQPWMRQLEEERRLRSEQQRAFEQRRRHDHLVFSQNELARQQEIKALQDQLKQLIEETKDLSQEIEIAASQPIVNPGTYHTNFFDRLRQLIKLMRKKIHDSASWLATFNSKSKAKAGYWGNVKTSGTKFMLSQERYMVT